PKTQAISSTVRGRIVFTRICLATDERAMISSVRLWLGKMRSTMLKWIVLESEAFEAYSLDDDHKTNMAIATPTPAKCMQNANQLIARRFNEEYARTTSRNSAAVRQTA